MGQLLGLVMDLLPHAEFVAALVQGVGGMQGLIDQCPLTLALKTQGSIDQCPLTLALGTSFCPAALMRIPQMMVEEW
jgi:hypothetical protein